MCGIVGYAGEKNNVSDVLLKGLKRLEYRGYDSCGIAIISSDGKLFLDRVKGRVDLLEEKVKSKKYKNLLCGIAHTRWATHGVPNEENAHPHTDCDDSIVVVHNGIIENYIELKEELKNHKFKSDTDTEVIAHLIEENIKKILKGSKLNQSAMLQPVFFQAFLNTLKKLKGSFAVAVIWNKTPGTVLAARRFSPLVIGRGNGENFLSSDVSGFLEYTKNVYFVDDDEIVFMDKNNIAFFDFDGKKKSKDLKEINWDIKMAEKTGYRHFMLKEIHEQDMGFENTIARRVLPVGEYILNKEIKLSVEDIKRFLSVHFIACGTAYHAAYVGKYVLEKFGIKSEIDIASEFPQRAGIIDKNTLVVAITQSGETADTIEAVRVARKNGNKVFAITNTVGSTVSRESDYVIYTHCGPEISVASTKAFTSQLAALYVIALHFAYIRGNLLITKAREFANELIEIPRLLRKTFECEKYVKDIVDKLEGKNDYLFIARGINYPIALEGALKLKEISYLHAEGYAAGEMKHGPIAIIDDGMPVVALATSQSELDLIKGNIEETKARGGFVIAIVDEESKKVVRPNYYIQIPKTSEYFSPVLSVIPLQLFAYYTALKRGRDIDRPRNLAKSVTVR